MAVMVQIIRAAIQSEILGIYCCLLKQLDGIFKGFIDSSAYEDDPCENVCLLGDGMFSMLVLDACDVQTRGHVLIPGPCARLL